MANFIVTKARADKIQRAIRLASFDPDIWGTLNALADAIHVAASADLEAGDDNECNVVVEG